MNHKTFSSEQAAHEVIPQITLGYLLNGWDTPRFQIVPSQGQFLLRVITPSKQYLY